MFGLFYSLLELFVHLFIYWLSCTITDLFINLFIGVYACFMFCYMLQQRDKQRYMAGNCLILHLFIFPFSLLIHSFIYLSIYLLTYFFVLCVLLNASTINIVTRLHTWRYILSLYYGQSPQKVLFSQLPNHVAVFLDTPPTRIWSALLSLLRRFSWAFLGVCEESRKTVIWLG